MASLRSPSSPSDGYTRFSDEFANSSVNNYGSNVTNSRTDGGGGDAMGTLDLGSRSSLHTGLHMSEDEHWEMNYHEAAIYLEEGLNNEKFDSHPSSPEELPAYLRVHNPWYHGLDLLASLVLILLAFTEDPAVPAFELPVWAHGTIELAALAVIGVELHLKLKWIGVGTILKHKRTMLKGITLLIMVLEAVVVLCRQSSHFRVTRALRPIFLVDTRHCGGVRRFIRQILQSLPPIVDMLGLLMFFVVTYSLLGYYLFSEHIDNGHFKTISDSFVSMFVLLTTANFPDVMMPSYAKSKWYALFFILYIITVLYVLMNLMLAVVYEAFTRIEREKCRALLRHRRAAARHAFRLLVSRRAPHHVRLRHFLGLMRHYAPHYSGLDVYLMFKQLNQSGTGGLSRQEFANLYEVFALRWAPQQARAPWYADSFLEPLGRAASVAVRWPYFEYLIYALIVGNGVAMVLRVCQAAGDLQDSARLLCASWDTWLFLTLFLVEAGLRMMASGLHAYLESGWNVFDLSVTLLALMGAVLLSMAPKLFIVVMFRPLRLMRLYKLKKRYRDVFGTLVLLSPLMSSAGCVMLVMYYFFAIVGMELFAEYDLKNCCVNTTVEDFYKFSENASTTLGYYYLNNFENILTSGVTLFELTVVNNWFILMNAYATVAGQFSRIYFMVFYLFTMVVLTIVVASVLEAFRFRIQYKRSTTKRDEEKLLHEEVHTNWDEAQRLGVGGDMADELRQYLPPGVDVTFIGSRPRTKEVLQRRMYQSEIQKWLAEEDENEGMPPSTTLTSSEDMLPPPLIQQPDTGNHQLRPGYQL
ncbi:two pore calcium channel protein 1-like isoform X1 [Hyposmocoma kahamanoa]|uniref:two pore calcium channel protein 1-like isoform X1 n=2 Tax=Hyposmocoma kahamanoa TaxID=1477025 RepID=UPI000E6D6797|nr:two pore calcium channel protein 1-like isoform X1 [Hyposmocoma kahamanoa]